MSVLSQKTVNNSLSIKGIGLHTGEPVNVKINPAEPNTGIVFKRTDLNNNNYIIPSVFNVTNTSFCTTVSNEFGVKVSTIEHLMGALFGLGVDNALIEVDSQEVPILDGSAKIFVERILSTGLELSNQPIKIIKIEKRISINEENMVSRCITFIGLIIAVFNYFVIK